MSFAKLAGSSLTPQDVHAGSKNEQPVVEKGQYAHISRWREASDEETSSACKGWKRSIEHWMGGLISWLPFSNLSPKARADEGLLIWECVSCLAQGWFR